MAICVITSGGAMDAARIQDGSGERRSKARKLTTSSRKRWDKEELRYLEAWAGVRSIAELSWRMQRTERALRCKMHRLGFSAKIKEGWGLQELKTSLKLSRAAVLHYIEAGLLRIHSAQVCLRPGTSLPPSKKNTLSPLERILPARKFAHAAQWSLRRVAIYVREGRYLLTHLRCTDISVRRIAMLPANRARLSRAVDCWLARPPGELGRSSAP